MIKLSAVIITYNEERNIARCLDSLKDVADEILVVDSYSTDSTAAICEQHGARVIQHAFEGYSEQKNFGNAQATHDYILSLDADECLSETLQQSIRSLKLREIFGAASFNRLTNYCGAWIRHCGWYPDKKIRLFDRRHARWEGLIHETLVFDKPVDVVQLRGDCLHYSYYSVKKHLDQANKFSAMSAQAMFNSGKRSNAIKLYLAPALKFVRCYVFQLGFLDGVAGFTVCRISSYAVYKKYLELKRLQQR